MMSATNRVRGDKLIKFFFFLKREGGDIGLFQNFSDKGGRGVHAYFDIFDYVLMNIQNW